MKSRRIPFILSTFLQMMKLLFTVFIILFHFSNPGESLRQILNIHTADITFSLALCSGEFVLLVLFLFGMFYPAQGMKHRIPVQVYKLFSAFASLLLIFVIPRSGDVAAVSDLNDILRNNQIIFLIILIFIDFAVCFVLLLYKEEFVQKDDNGQNFPDYNEIEIKE